jgi:hypothetical protein
VPLYLFICPRTSFTFPPSTPIIKFSSRASSEKNFNRGLSRPQRIIKIWMGSYGVDEYLPLNTKNTSFFPQNKSWIAPALVAILPVLNDVSIFNEKRDVIEFDWFGGIQ